MLATKVFIFPINWEVSIMRKPCVLHRAYIAAVVCVLLLAFATSASAYPVWGERWELRQPDGSKVPVIIWGDEFYQVVEDTDGFTLIRDPASGVICYAELSADGNDLVSTGVEVYTTDPFLLGLQPRILVSV